jgi:hypothetical protein
VSIRIDEVASRRDLKDFVDLPFRHYSGDPSWVPPLKSDVRWVLDTKKNPFWKHAWRVLYLARSNGRVVGRIAAIADDAHNRVHSDRTGFFGFFECENDPDAAKALLDAAEKKVRELLPGCDLLRGPVNPSLNDEAGALVPGESDPGPPVLMMTYNPAYYLDLFASAGFRKEKDLVAILAPVDDRSFRRLSRIAEGVQRREPRLTFRMIRMKRYDEDIALLKEIYNGAWASNWGFVPMTSEELDAMAKKLKPLVYPPYIWFAEMDGTPAAVHVALPDYNQVLIMLGGSLLPFGWLTFLLGKKSIDRCRTLALGVLPRFRKKGIDAVLFYKAMQEGIKIGVKSAEFSWMLEDNDDILKPLEVFGGRIYRRYRIVGRPIAAAAT